MGKKDGNGDAGHPVGNKDPNRRGRGPKDAIGQEIPEKVRKQIDPKGKSK